MRKPEKELQEFVQVRERQRGPGEDPAVPQGRPKAVRRRPTLALPAPQVRITNPFVRTDFRKKTDFSRKIDFREKPIRFSATDCFHTRQIALALGERQEEARAEQGGVEVGQRAFVQRYGVLRVGEG